MTGRARQILFVHDQFPGQFGGFAAWAATAGWEVWTASRGAGAPGARHIRYAPHRAPSAETHAFAQALDRAVLMGQAAAKACLDAKSNGLAPDVIISHTGPGAGLFLSEIFPEAVQLAYCEWWYNAPGVDTAFLAELGGSGPRGPDALILEHCRNQPIAQELLTAGQGLCPAAFQAAQFPEALQGMLTVMPDGVDCVRFSPREPGVTRHPVLSALPDDAPVVTYATRGMEPHRGFPQAMAAFAEVQARHKSAVMVIAGDEGVHYGGSADRAVDWKRAALERFALDPARVQFTGMLGADDYLWLLRRSDAHLYLTVPFVLSWSMLDAMAVGAPLVLSDTAPVREVADGGHAHLVPFAEPAQIADALRDVLDAPGTARARGQAARARMLEGHDAARIYPQKAAWLEGLIEAKRPMGWAPPLAS